MPTYHNFIDGAWVPSVAGQLFDDRNPAHTDDVIGRFQKSTREDVEAAVDAARRAYRHWRLVPAPRRAEILFRAAQLIADRKEALARDMTREMGKVLDETRGDVQEAIDMTYFIAGEGRRQYGQTAPSELRDKFAMSVRQPLGVCAIITPWNFPMAIPSWKIIPALVCGNTVVFKPASQTPLCPARASTGVITVRPTGNTRIGPTKIAAIAPENESHVTVLPQAGRSRPRFVVPARVRPATAPNRSLAGPGAVSAFKVRYGESLRGRVDGRPAARQSRSEEPA